MTTSPPSSKQSTNSTLVDICDETAPLLGPAPALDPSTQSAEVSLSKLIDDAAPVDAPLPWTQILLLCYARVVEPIAFFSIFPFITEMILNTGGVKEEDAGFYAGMIESLFSVTQMLLMIPWGRAADKFGRKPILVVSLFGCSVATALFGLSANVWQMIAFRCFAGVFAGSIVTIRVMISENSTHKTQARAFSFFGFAGNCGLWLGPLIGGLLTSPAKQYPGIFGSIQFFNDYPYALACFVSGSVGLSATIVTALFVKETLPPKKKDDQENAEPSPVELTFWDLLKAPGVSNVLVVYACIMLLAFSYTAVAPVFQATSPALGGLGFKPQEIGIFLGIGGVAQSLWTLLIFPPLQNRFGTRLVLKLCVYVWPFFFVVNPIYVFVLRGGASTTSIYPYFGLSLLVGSGVSMAFTGVMLALNDVSPTPRTLGMLNAIALSMTSGLRAFAPILFTSIYATGIKVGILDGYFIWAVLVALALGSVLCLQLLPPDKVEE